MQIGQILPSYGVLYITYAFANFCKKKKKTRKEELSSIVTLTPIVNHNYDTSYLQTLTHVIPTDLSMVSRDSTG